MKQELFSPRKCPKREQWFVDGGHCGAAHVCVNCTGNPDFVLRKREHEEELARTNGTVAYETR